MGNLTPLFNDEFTDLPLKRALAQVLKKRDAGAKVVGAYCSYAPVELIWAMGGVPAVLCAFSNAAIPKAEETLPANLCPLIKSSYGFIELKTCPFFEVTDAVVGETTCDGKKKMFELIAEKRPLHVLDLPQCPTNEGAAAYWRHSINGFKTFLEKSFDTSISEAALEQAIQETNRKNRLVEQILGFGAHRPAVITWQEMYDVTSYAMVTGGSEAIEKLQEILAILTERREKKMFTSPEGTKRVLLTGCPVGGDVLKVLKLVDEEGAAIVGLDSCTGLKAYAGRIEEKSGDPLLAIAQRYLQIPCACMTPNLRRMEVLKEQVDLLKPDLVIDLVLQACHTYNVEAVKVESLVRNELGTNYLKIVTDFSSQDVGQLKTRIGAALEMC
ncbi:double-cubane-cluster-containing anaerobic reductase [Geomesophilobacter sediminis]|uniref:2-hydroxyacyl-CoA dehydratase n=1 Tax=Geomesophilobacter sediminis TaxID=2798584 RepID=A0A8J7SBA2_9BACT|nr:double-cubane-cluster-containing anaerobic reductase [Geomesophilobacter sediminis]MBJ6727960.1 2-hydroxyacyl-CoA dehydratase [Geomesophilobacter sediminis]